MPLCIPSRFEFWLAYVTNRIKKWQYVASKDMAQKALPIHFVLINHLLRWKLTAVL